MYVIWRRFDMLKGSIRALCRDDSCGRTAIRLGVGGVLFKRIVWGRFIWFVRYLSGRCFSWDIVWLEGLLYMEECLVGRSKHANRYIGHGVTVE